VNVKALLERAPLDSPTRLSILAATADITRSALVVELAAAAGCLPFDDAPSVTSWVYTEGQGASVIALDVWHRSFGTLGLHGSAPLVSPALASGVMTQVTERIALGQDASPAAGGPRLGTNVGAIFEAAAEQGIPTRLFLGALPTDAPFTSEQRGPIEDAIGAGLAVIAPARPVMVGATPRLGWWVVDPGTGAAVDVLDMGGGATTLEQVVVRLVNQLGAAAAAPTIVTAATRQEQIQRVGLQLVRLLEVYAEEILRRGIR
jgi:hypothetical protein